MAPRVDAAVVDAAPAVSKEAPVQGLVLPAALLGLAIVLFFTLDTKVAAPNFTLVNFLTLAVILFLAGVMSGMCGFGFAAPGALSLFLLPPVTAIPMLQGLSTINQLTSVAKLRADMPKTLREWFPRGPGPVIIGGLVGVQIGVWILNTLSTRTLTITLGSLIIGYCIYMTYKPTGLKIRGFDGAGSGVAVGVLGGTVGGFTAQPGMMVIVWAGLRDMTKKANRALVQPYIIVLQIAAVATNAIQNPQNFGVGYWTMLALTIPVVMPGTLTGVWLYHRLSDRDFKRTSYALLGLGALALVIRASL